jgi:septation ring formation regulator EzrA
MELYNEITEDIAELQRKTREIEKNLINIQKRVKSLEDEKTSAQNGSSEDDELYAVYGGD